MLSGLFEDLGAWLGLPPMLSELIGWVPGAGALRDLVLPAALAAVSALVPLMPTLARPGTWLRGRDVAIPWTS